MRHNVWACDAAPAGGTGEGVQLRHAAPFVFQNGVFYDTWAFTQQGRSIGPFPQTTWQQWGTVPIPMDTIGGTLLMRREVPGCGLRYTIDDVDRGLTSAAAARGFGVFADPATHVFHCESYVDLGA